ncbi:MAG TPA: HAD family hydrolase, partial [Methanocorpusculum sp.]|nr:HAD family hydrolase [Methanocorpusculum sp.]
MTTSSGIRAVIFDMDNTLHNLHAAAQAAADAVSLFCGTEFTLHFTPLNRDRPSLPGEFKDFFGDEKTASQAFSLYYMLELQCLREFDGMREVLQSLKDAGIKMVVLSNSDGHSVYPRLSLMGLDGFFDAVFVRESFAEIKPSPAVFSQVLDFLK